MPVFTVPIHEYNDCHQPGGQPSGGRFCSDTGAGATLAEVTARLQHIGIKQVEGEDHPHTIAAAAIMADTLAEMRDKGYRMPRAVLLQTASRDEPGGFAHEERNWPSRVLPTALYHAPFQVQIRIPHWAPTDVPVDALFKAAFAKQTSRGPAFAATSVREMVIHEMGHVLRGTTQPFEYDDWGVTRDEHLDAAVGVSFYAGENLNEFVSETFLRLYRGDTLPAKSLALYTKLKGPRIR